MVLCIALCLAFGGAALASSAGNSFGYVNDAVGLLSLDEQQELETTAAQLAERYGCGVYVIIVDDYTDYTNGSTRDFAKETYINYDLGVGEDKNGDPIWRSLYEIEESVNRCTIEFSNKNHYINVGEIPSLSLLQEWNYLKERPQNYGVDAFHIVAYFTFTYENINGNYYIKNYHYTTDARIFGMNYLEFDSSNGKIGRWVHKK